ncbi:hypothetical protein [Streptomyces sp. CBMA123]|uniref:hypothetical protein n=1 Tax=Streptomyces sp. CBMA123 TaxID=1896313 RepID=UPI001661A52E|nr:hypothetical protein [Streptomyces sp. CBMA123]MBD0689605.1 hypothetical protein [Streptomyces sp. CBMA123]
MPEDSVPLQDAQPKSTSRPRPPSPKPRPGLGGLLRAALPAALAVLGLALTILGFVRFTDTFEQTRAYRATPTCAADAKPGADCVTLESGRVTKKEEEAGSDSTDYMLTVSRETAPTGRYAVGKAFYEDVDAGTTVELRILHGKVFELSFQGHRSRPENTPYLTIFEFSGLIGVGMIMIIGGLFGDLEFMLFISLGYSAGATLLTAFGSLLLISLQWPLLVTLPIAVTCWLIAAAISHSAFKEF